MGGVLASGNLASMFKVFPQHGTIIRMCAIFDQQFCPLFGRLPTQVGNALLRDDDGHVMFGRVHMGDHGNDTGDVTVLGDGFGCEDADPSMGVFREIKPRRRAVSGWLVIS